MLEHIEILIFWSCKEFILHNWSIPIWYLFKCWCCILRWKKGLLNENGNMARLQHSLFSCRFSSIRGLKITGWVDYVYNDVDRWPLGQQNFNRCSHYEWNNKVRNIKGSAAGESDLLCKMQGSYYAIGVNSGTIYARNIPKMISEKSNFWHKSNLIPPRLVGGWARFAHNKSIRWTHFYAWLLWIKYMFLGQKLIVQKL